MEFTKIAVGLTINRVRKARVEHLDALSINGWDYPGLSTDLEIPEWSHLSRQSQDDWSRALVPILADRYADFRGQGLNDMLGIAPPDSQRQSEPAREESP